LAPCGCSDRFDALNAAERFKQMIGEAGNKVAAPGVSENGQKPENFSGRHFAPREISRPGDSGGSNLIFRSIILCTPPLKCAG